LQSDGIVQWKHAIPYSVTSQNLSIQASMSKLWAIVYLNHTCHPASSN